MLDMSLFAQRREWLTQQLDEDSIVIVVGNVAKTRSKNIKYHFRADNDLFYLTGFEEQNALAVIRPMHKIPFVLFTRPNDANAETSFGARAGMRGAKEVFGANQAFDINEIEKQIVELFESRSKVYYLDEQDIYSDRILTWMNNQKRTTGFDVIKQHRQLLPLAPLLHNKRVVKSDEEVALIKKAVAASVSAHKKVMKIASVGMNELQIESAFVQEIAQFGCRDVSYPSIVASGNNACCLHYEENNCNLDDGNLLLIDAGAEYNYYCSDITRTWPINGKFSVEQAQLYQVVLKAIDSAIAKVKPGLAWNEIHQTCIEHMARGLLELGLLTGTFEQVMADESHKIFTVHKTGHWLGMDVHDVGSYHQDDNNWLTLVPNMVFTIEPGIYIPQSCTLVDEKWRGIGIRIEDDILVTQTGAENLSEGVPRTIEAIESLMRNN